jgi:hypothetical protein
VDPYREVAASKNVIELHESGGPLFVERQAALDARGSSRVRLLWRRVRARFLGYHSALTELDCRLPNGQMGKVEAVYENGEWILVCRVP